MNMNDMNLNFDTMNLINIQKKLILHDEELNELLNIDVSAVVREKDRLKDSQNKKKQQAFDNSIRRESFEFEIIQISQVFVETARIAATQIFIIQVFNSQFSQSITRRKREEHKEKREEREERDGRDEDLISEMSAHMMSSFTF